jgi:hypothetical protein
MIATLSALVEDEVLRHVSRTAKSETKKEGQETT